MPAYYNENDPKAAAWLRELIKVGIIAPGDVDERSIEDVYPADLWGYTQCHFFAGIGGWSYALKLAGWPDTRPVWTGSCPCQPFSQAGKGKGAADERHLWPAWLHLVEHNNPPVVFGEQVGSPAGLLWLSSVQNDLEARGFAFGAADLPAASVGTPHIRQRLYWVADHDNARLERYAGNGDYGVESRRFDQAQVGSHWASSDQIVCRDGKRRPVEPGTFPLAHGVPGRVGLLRGYGNAIVPEVAKAFIIAYEEARTTHAGPA